MTIIIDIRPEVQAELSRQAAAHGVDIGAYAASLLEEAAHMPSRSKTISQSELDNTLQELALFSHKIPLLSDDAFSRRACIEITTDAGKRTRGGSRRGIGGFLCLMPCEGIRFIL
jgi:hypothetical protein